VATLVVFFSVFASRSFVISQLYIRSLLTVHRLLRVSRFVVCYIAAVPSVLCLCRPPVASVIVRPPNHLCGSAFVYCLRRRCLSEHLVLRLSQLPCLYALHPFPFLPLIFLFFLRWDLHSRYAPLLIPFYRILPLLHQVWLMPSGFRLSISALCVCHSRTLSYIPSGAPHPHIVLFTRYDVSRIFEVYIVPSVQMIRRVDELGAASTVQARPSIRRFPIRRFFICNVCWLCPLSVLTVGSSSAGLMSSPMYTTRVREGTKLKLRLRSLHVYIAYSM